MKLEIQKEGGTRFVKHFIISEIKLQVRERLVQLYMVFELLRRIG